MNPCFGLNGNPLPSRGLAQKITSGLIYTLAWTALIAGIVSMVRCAVL